MNLFVLLFIRDKRESVYELPIFISSLKTKIGLLLDLYQIFIFFFSFNFFVTRSFVLLTHFFKKFLYKYTYLF